MSSIAGFYQSKLLLREKKLCEDSLTHQGNLNHLTCRFGALVDFHAFSVLSHVAFIAEASAFAGRTASYRCIQWIPTGCISAALSACFVRLICWTFSWVQQKVNEDLINSGSLLTSWTIFWQNAFAVVVFDVSISTVASLAANIWAWAVGRRFSASRNAT